MRHYKIAFCLLFISGIIYAQSGSALPERLQPNTENFKWAMAISDPTADQLDTITRLCMYYSQVNLDSSQILGNRAVNLGGNHTDQSQHAQALLQLGYATGKAGDLDAAEKLLLKGKSIYESLGIEGKIANANNKLGEIYTQKGEFDAALKHYLSAAETWEILKDSQSLFMPYLNISQVFYRINQDDKVEEYNAKALKWAEITNNERGKMMTTANAGIFLHEKGDSYYEMADTDSLNSQIYKDSAFLFFGRALKDYSTAVSMARKTKNKGAEVYFLSNMMVLKMSMDDPAGALELGRKAEPIAQELGGVLSILRIQLSMTRALRLTGQAQESVTYGEKVLKVASENGIDKEQRLAHMHLHKSYKGLGDFEKSLEHFEKFQASIGERDRIEKVEAIAEIESKFQTAEKEKQILEQKNDILELESANSKIEKQRNYLIGGGLFLGLLGFLGFRLSKVQKDRNDKKAFAEALMFGQEEERKRIARDLHDGIGQSLLLMKKQLVSNHTVTLENQNLITHTLDEVRSISRDLHPFQLEKFGLTATINEAILKIENSTDLFITKEIENIDQLFSDKAEINIYRTIQEAFNNIVKHSEATAAKINIQSVDNDVFMKIQDNGKGFDHELAIVTSKSLGLRTMYERIAGIGGKLKIEKGATKGTIIEISIPKN